MNTEELIKKYQILISKALDCKPEHIKFYKDGSKIGSIDYEKKEEWGEDYILDWELGNYSVMLDKENNLPEQFLYKDKPTDGAIPFSDYDKVIGSFKLYHLPYCCAFLVSCNAFVNYNFRKKGIGTILNLLRQDIGKLLNFTSILCTDIEDNIGQRKILKKNGWKDVHSVINKRTNNKLFLSVIDI